MIGCVTKNGVEYITKIEHFRDLMDENMYAALTEFIQNLYEDRTIKLISEVNRSIDDYEILKNDYDELQERCYESDMGYEELERKTDKLQAFYDCMRELYGQGLEVANWHLNGDLEPFDNFFDSAEEAE